VPNAALAVDQQIKCGIDKIRRKGWRDEACRFIPSLERRGVVVD
jgi:hypothetical protein